MSRDIKTTNALLERYHNFTRKWRIRINPDKCKILQNEHCTNVEEAFFGDEIVKKVDYLKYLGYWIGGSKGRLKNDEHIKAQATQLRFKIRTLRQQIGEQLTRVYLESYATPAILHGAELGSINSNVLDSYQSWSLTELMGIGRLGKSSGYMEGEVTKLCAFADYRGPTWSQIRMTSAMTTYRSVARMTNKTLPKQTECC